MPWLCHDGFHSEGMYIIVVLFGPTSYFVVHGFNSTRKLGSNDQSLLVDCKEMGRIGTVSIH
jgi:hypothetical protein